MAKINLRLTSNTIIELNIEERITFIGGDSGTGKTLLMQAIFDAKENSTDIELKGIDIDKFELCFSENEVANLLTCHNKVILIDRYDIFDLKTKQTLWKKMSELDNTWIIMTRNPDIPYNFGHSSSSYKEIKQKTDNNGNITLYLKSY